MGAYTVNGIGTFVLAYKKTGYLLFRYLLGTYLLGTHIQMNSIQIWVLSHLQDTNTILKSCSS